MAKPNLGALADAIYAKGAELAAANQVVSTIESERRDLENQLLAAMEEAGTDIVRGKTVTVSIGERERINGVDWDEIYKFVQRRKAHHLFERRLAQNACKEMVEQVLKGLPIPGTQTSKFKVLNVRGTK
jgi:hypothetical protein